MPDEGRPTRPAAQLERDHSAVFLGHRPDDAVGVVGGETFEISQRRVIIAARPESGPASGDAKDAFVAFRDEQTAGNGGDRTRPL